jgi:hypothetical protein
MSEQLIQQARGFAELTANLARVTAERDRLKRAIDIYANESYWFPLSDTSHFRRFFNNGDACHGFRIAQYALDGEKE